MPPSPLFPCYLYDDDDDDARLQTLEMDIVVTAVEMLHLNDEQAQSCMVLFTSTCRVDHSFLSQCSLG